MHVTFEIFQYNWNVPIVFVHKTVIYLGEFFCLKIENLRIMWNHSTISLFKTLFYSLLKHFICIKCIHIEAARFSEPSKQVCSDTCSPLRGSTDSLNLLTHQEAPHLSPFVSNVPPCSWNALPTSLPVGLMRSFRPQLQWYLPEGLSSPTDWMACPSHHDSLSWDLWGTYHNCKYVCLLPTNIKAPWE